MREIRTSGSEGGGTGHSTGPSYPYRLGTYGIRGVGQVQSARKHPIARATPARRAGAPKDMRAAGAHAAVNCQGAWLCCWSRVAERTANTAASLGAAGTLSKANLSRGRAKERLVSSEVVTVSALSKATGTTGVRC